MLSQELQINKMYKKHPQLKHFYQCILDKKGEQEAKDFLSSCLKKYANYVIPE